VTENNLASQVAALETENKDLQNLLAQSSAAKKEAAEDAKHLRDALLEAAKTVADVAPDQTAKTMTLRIKNAVLFAVDNRSWSAIARRHSVRS
jgi:hypothetical protein